MSVRKANVEFDETTHTYRLHGRVLPSVTAIIGRVLPGFQADDYYLQRGRALHHGCRLLDEGRLDWNSVSPEIAGRIQAFAKFRSDCPAETVARERSLAHSTYGFAGTLDLMLKQDRLLVCDMKSTLTPQARLQLAAYSLLWKHNYGQTAGQTPGGAVGVQLNDDGSYRTMWLNKQELATAEQTFLGALSVYGFMEIFNLRGIK